MKVAWEHHKEVAGLWRAECEAPGEAMTSPPPLPFPRAWVESKPMELVTVGISSHHEAMDTRDLLLQALLPACVTPGVNGEPSILRWGFPTPSRI